ncbi:MAG: RHS repeat-associated core domain-containing protein, partial [Candidatus Entotheonellia bacterium]
VYATRVNVPDYMVKGGVTYRLVLDQLGSVRLVVNTATGAVVHRIDYDEFGQVIQNTSPGFQPFGFAGGQYDEQSGLGRLGSRDYFGAVGRWMAKDPIGFAGGQANLYGYVLADPINYEDPTGECIWKAVASGVVGGLINGVLAAGQTGATWQSVLGGGAVGLAAGFVGGLIPTPGVSGAVTTYLTEAGNRWLNKPTSLGAQCLIPQGDQLRNAILGGIAGGTAAGIAKLAGATGVVPGLLDTGLSLLAGNAASFVDKFGKLPNPRAPLR